MMVFSACSNLALDGYQAIQIVFLARDLGTGPGSIGLVLALGGIGGICGALLTGRLAARFGAARAFLISEGVAAPMMLLGPLATNGAGLIFFAAAGFGTSLGVIASNVQTSTFRQRYCPPELFGRITASTTAVAYGVVPLAAFLGGVLGETIGVRQTLWLFGGVQVAAFGLLLLSPLRTRRDFPARAAVAHLDRHR